jgi:hypothetical protein
VQIRIIERPSVRDHVALERLARAEIARVLGPDFRFPAPPPPTTEFRIYLWEATQQAWYVTLPVIGYVDVWAVDIVGEVIPDEKLREELLDEAESEFNKLGGQPVDGVDSVH